MKRILLIDGVYLINTRNKRIIKTLKKEYLCIFNVFALFENRVLGIEAYFALIIAANACLYKKK